MTSVRRNSRGVSPPNSPRMKVSQAVLEASNYELETEGNSFECAPCSGRNQALEVTIPPFPTETRSRRLSFELLDGNDVRIISPVKTMGKRTPLATTTKTDPTLHVTYKRMIIENKNAQDPFKTTYTMYVLRDKELNISADTSHDQTDFVAEEKDEGCESKTATTTYTFYRYDPGLEKWMKFQHFYTRPKYE